MAAGRLKPFVRSDWSTAILVCAKCTKKLDGGFGKKGKRPLAKMLRKALGLSGFRKSRMGVVEVRCLGVCPRGAVTLIDARRPYRWHLVPQGSDVDALVRELGLTD